jgi:hypothetical protein
MSASVLGFKRLVLSQPSSAESAAARLAAEFAELLGAEWLGLFIEDLGLRYFSAMPFAREIHTIGGDWRGVEPERFCGDLDLAATRAERRFAEAAGRRFQGRLQVVRGGGAAALAEFSRAGDILVLRAPTAADWFAEPQASLLAAALRSPAGVLLAPRRLELPRGGVTALATRADDPALAAARAIAEAAGEPLDVIDWRASREPRSGQPRLVIATRGEPPNEVAIAIAARWRAPLLSLNRPPGGR